MDFLKNKENIELFADVLHKNPISLVIDYLNYFFSTYLQKRIYRAIRVDLDESLFCENLCYFYM
jgi:uncharacterized membrane protein